MADIEKKQEMNPRRRFLVAATSIAGGIAGAAVATPFVLSMMPSERAKAAGAPVEVDISKIEPGMLLLVEWRGKVVWILDRTPEMLATLKKLDSQVADPKSEKPQQPAYCQNETRSIKPAKDRVPFSSPARSISLAKRSRICAANPPPSKNARSEFSETHHEGHRGHEDAFTFASPSCSSCSLWLIRSFNSWKQRHRLAHDMFIWQSPPLRVFE